MEGFVTQTIEALLTPVSYGPNDDAETVILQSMIPAGLFAPGVVIRVTAAGKITTTSGSPVLDIRLRLGPVTLTGAILGGHSEVGPSGDVTWRVWNGNNQTDEGFHLEALTTIQANGTDTTTGGLLVAMSGATFAFAMMPVSEDALVPFDPTVDNVLELTMDWDDLAANDVLVRSGLVVMEYSV